MKLFGALAELTKIVFRQNNQEITLDSNTSTTYTAARQAELPPGDADSILVGEASTQTLTNKTIDGDNNTLSDISIASLKTVLGDADEAIVRDAAGAVVSAKIVNANIDAAAAIDATKIADGSVTSTEFQYLGGVTSDIQTQLNGKVTGPGSATDNALARFDGTTGAIIQNSVAILADTGELSGLTQLDVDNIRVNGNTISSTDTNGDIVLDPNGTGVTRAVGALKSDTSLILEDPGAGTNTITIQAPTLASDYTLTLPTNDGSANQLLQTNGSGVLTWANVSSSESITTVTNADYTILDGDGFTTINVSTGNTDRTITLPAASSNANRKITIIKIDTGTGKVTIARAGADTIEGTATSIDIYQQFQGATLRSDGSAEFNILGSYTEWASNSDSTDATTTASGFVAGPQGAQGVLGTTDLTDWRQKYVQWQLPLLPGDSVVVEFSNDQTNWYPAIGYMDAAVDPGYGISSIMARHDSPSTTNTMGIGIFHVDSDNSSVTFGRSAIRYNGYTSGWNGYTNTYWRVRKTTNRGGLF